MADSMTTGNGRRPSLLDLGVLCVLSVALAAVATMESIVAPRPVRIATGFLFVFVLPGYAFTASLYPRQRLRTGGRPLQEGEPSLSPVEHLVLIVGLSLMTVPIIVLLLSLVGVPITPQASLWTVASVTVLTAVVAGVRRFRQPAVDRGSVGVRGGASTVVGGIRDRDGSGWTAAVVALVLLVAGGGVAGFALVDDQRGEQYTELSLLAVENGSGNLTADDYPDSLSVGDPEPVVVAIANNEGRPVGYTVVVELLDVETAGQSRAVEGRIELDRFTVTTDAGESVRQRRPVTLDANPGPGEYKLAFSLYRGDAPADVASVDPYRQVHVWTTVSEGDA